MSGGKQKPVRHAPENSVQNSAPQKPVRDSRGRLRGGNPGNSGGKKGRSGPPTKAFKEFCSAVASEATFQQTLAKVANDPTGKDYAAAVKLVLAYAEGLPVQVNQVVGKDGGPIQHAAALIYLPANGR